MSNGEWLPLLNYSTKHNISMSTLRRRIKAHAIQYKLEDGKYYIFDDSDAGPMPEHASEQTTVAPTKHSTHAFEKSVERPAAPAAETHLSSSFVEASVLSSANRLVEEIKAAYAKILQEKEEQIRLLKEDAVDLRMLVKILEDRLTAASNKKPSSQGDLVEGSSKPAEDDFLFSDFQTRDI